jgi:hypothetical protein
MSAAIRTAKTSTAKTIRPARKTLALLAAPAIAGSLLLCLPAAAHAAVRTPVDSTAAIQALLNNPVNGVVNLPSGTFTVSPTLQLAHGETIIGHQTTLQVAASSGDYVAVLEGATVSTDLSGLKISGVTFDQNSAANPITNLQALYGGDSRFVIRVSDGADISITNDSFLNTNNIITIATGGATSNVTISGNTFTGGTATPWHDHSSIYTSGTGTTISGNTFTGSHDITAIEVHGNQATVTGNTVSGYYRGINIVANNTTFTGNTITGSVGPVELWSTVAPGLHNITVTGNALGQNVAGWAPYLKTVNSPMPPAPQLQQVFDAPTSTYPFTAITVSGNQA